VVEQVPEETVSVEELNDPVLLLFVHVMVPVGLFPDTVAVQLAGELIEIGFGEQETDVEDGGGT
jgi:hypothetical protein